MVERERNNSQKYCIEKKLKTQDVHKEMNKQAAIHYI